MNILSRDKIFETFSFAFTLSGSHENILINGRVLLGSFCPTFYKKTTFIKRGLKHMTRHFG